MGGGASQSRQSPYKSSPKGKSDGAAVYGVLSDYLTDLKGHGLNNTEVFDALKRKEELMRAEHERKRVNMLQSGSIKVLALNQLAMNLKSNDEVRRIGFHSEKISTQLKSAKETMNGLKNFKNILGLTKEETNSSTPAYRLGLGTFGFAPDQVEERMKMAEAQIGFLTQVKQDLEVEMVHIKRHSEKISSRKTKKSVKILPPSSNKEKNHKEEEEKKVVNVKPFIALRNRPMLQVKVLSDSLHASHSGEENNTSTDAMAASSSSECKASSASGGVQGVSRYSLKLHREDSGGSNYCVSPRGTVRLGDFNIGERGLYTLSSFIIEDGVASGSGNHPPMVSEGRGFIDFLEICLLGCGASATVKEAIHVPSFTLVALKMMPIYNQEKRRNVGRELAVLCTLSYPSFLS